MPPAASAVAANPAAAERASTESPAPDSPTKLHHEFLAQAALANRNTHRLMDLIRRMEACDGHIEYACPTLAHYLELVCGVSRIAARQRIRVARALGQLPLIDHEFAAGRLSYAKVRSLVRVATPENEEEWVAKALKLPAEDLETVVARSKPGDRPNRRLLTAALNAQTTRMLVDLPAEEMEIVNLALDEVRRQVGGKLSAAEALTHLCASWLGGDYGEVKTAERFQVIVHVGEEGKSWVETADGQAPLKPEVVERLLCDCTLRLQREKDGVMAVSRAQRTVSEVTRRAVAARDGRRCRVPGCRRRCWIQAHHLEWVIRGGRHLVKNLIFLCYWHHVQHHDGKLLILISREGEITFAAKAGWMLGDDGQLTADKSWWWDRLLAKGVSEVEIVEARAILDGDYENAWIETPKEDRAWVFGPGKGKWEVREGRVEYGKRSRGIVSGLGAKRSRGIVLMGSGGSETIPRVNVGGVLLGQRYRLLGSAKPSTVGQSSHCRHPGSAVPEALL